MTLTEKIQKEGIAGCAVIFMEPSDGSCHYAVLKRPDGRYYGIEYHKGPGPYDAMRTAENYAMKGTKPAYRAGPWYRASSGLLENFRSYKNAQSAKDTILRLALAEGV